MQAPEMHPQVLVTSNLLTKLLMTNKIESLIRFPPDMNNYNIFYLVGQRDKAVQLEGASDTATIYTNSVNEGIIYLDE